MSKQSFVNLDLSVDETDITGGAIEILKEIRPAWKPTDIKFKVSLYFQPRGNSSLPSHAIRSCSIITCNLYQILEHAQIYRHGYYYSANGYSQTKNERY